MVNVGKYAIHWASGYILFSSLKGLKRMFVDFTWFDAPLGCWLWADLISRPRRGNDLIGLNWVETTHKTYIILPLVVLVAASTVILGSVSWKKHVGDETIEMRSLEKNRRHVEVEDVLQLQPTSGPSLNIKLPKMSRRSRQRDLMVFTLQDVPGCFATSNHFGTIYRFFSSWQKVGPGADL